MINEQKYCFFPVIANKKKSSWNMSKTPSEMHMPNMEKIDTIIFEIIEKGRGVLLHPESLTVSITPDRMGYTLNDATL